MANYRQTRFPAIPTVIKYLIIINVAVWLTELMWNGNWFIDFFSLHDFRSPLFKPHQLISHLFLHEARDEKGQIVFAHIFFNMFALWVFGSYLENYWGPKRFLNFYLICGIGAGVIYLITIYLKSPVSDDPILGASGAIFGVLVAFGYTFPNTEMFIIPIPFPVKAKYLVVGYILLELFTGFQDRPGDNVAHFAHLGGALVGFLMVVFWNRTNKRDFY